MSFPNRDAQILAHILEYCNRTSVPRPPMLVPSSIPFASRVKLDSSTAAGTLLMTWLDATAHSMVFLSITFPRKCCTDGIAPIFPAKIKKQTKVASSQ